MPDNDKKSHPQKVRKHFLSAAEDELTDEIILDLLLTFTVQGKDTGQFAKELIEKYGSLDNVLSAPSREITGVKGLGDSSAFLLKLVSFIKNGVVPAANSESNSVADNPQPGLFNGFEKIKTESDHIKSVPEASKELSTHPKHEQLSSEPKEKSIVVNESPELAEKKPDNKVREVEAPTQTQQINETKKQAQKRKLQVCNGHYLDFDLLARFIQILNEMSDKDLKLKDIETETGIPASQVKNRISAGRAMGIFDEKKLKISPFGKLVLNYDLFFEKIVSLEFCHYLSASNFGNLIWYEVFNTLLVQEEPLTYEGWINYFMYNLRDNYSEKSLKSHIHKEVRFIIDAYTEKNFNRLKLLQQLPDESYYLVRHADLSPWVLAATIYHYCSARNINLFQIGETASTPGSPAMLFGIDADTFRHLLEDIHDRGWIRYETTHNLDQVRLRQGYTPLEFIAAHFEDRKPEQKN